MFGQNRPNSNDLSNNQQGKKGNETKKTELYRIKIPWTLNLAYAMNYFDNGLKNDVVNNSLMFSGDVELSPKWKVGFSSGFDIKENAFTYTRLSFSRDLDSWRLNFNWTPFGINSSYNFFIGVKSSVLSDLKWDKNKPRDKTLF